MLLVPSNSQWLEEVLSNFDAFLLDHASCEKKASSMAMSMISHYPDRVAILNDLVNLALEELSHFRQVVKLILARGLILQKDNKDYYINKLNKEVRKQREEYFLDRLLLGSIVEARGHERFSLIANALPVGELKTFYDSIARSEGRHFELFLSWAAHYFQPDIIEKRLQELLQIEANVLEDLPLRAALH